MRFRACFVGGRSKIFELPGPDPTTPAEFAAAVKEATSPSGFVTACTVDKAGKLSPAMLRLESADLIERVPPDQVGEHSQRPPPGSSFGGR